MDAQNSTSPAAAPASGGTVEPANRPAGTEARRQKPRAPASERYELRDPFNETTYRIKSLADVVAKAEQLGSTRFTALAADGKRTPIVKVAGEWHRAAQLPALPERPIEAVKDEAEPSKTSARAAPPDATRPAARSEAVAPPKTDIEAERAARIAQLEATLQERYVIKRAPVSIGSMTVGQTEYRFRGDTSRIAFTESTFRLATDTNSPSVARSMVDVAQARDWSGLRVAGSEDFRRLVWLEASVRGVKAIGYEPNPADLDMLRRERDARQTNRIEQVRETGASAVASVPASASAEKTSARGSGGRKAVLAAIEAVLVSRNVPEARREAVLATATEQLAQRVRAGQNPRVRVYDKAAPSQRPAVAPVREVSRSRERQVPALLR